MFLSNVNNLSITLFLLFVGVSFIFAYLLFKKQKSPATFICLCLSFLFLSVNIFEIKGGLSQNTQGVNGSNILFVLDVSKSMDVQDIFQKNNSSSRLSTSKSFISNYLDKQGNNKYGLFVFAGETLEILPFTNDLGLYKTILQGVDKYNVSKYGSEFLGIFRSLSYFFTEENKDSLVVILTDGGEEDEADFSEYVDVLVENNIQVLIVGVGSLKGAYIPISRNPFGQIQYKIYNGKRIVSKLNEPFLESLSSKYNFEYIHLDKLGNFNKIEKKLKGLSQEIIFKKDINSRVDLTYVFACISLIFFVLFLLFEYRVGKR